MGISLEGKGVMLLVAVLASAAVAAVQGAALSFDTSNQDRLILTHVVWSHGSSTPGKLIPSDKGNNESTWEEGLGALTQRGREEALRLGTLLHARYVQQLKIFGAKDAQRRSYVRSADCNRTISTAAAVMAGFLPADPAHLGTAKWPLYWIPYPVHSVPSQFDALLNPEAACPTVEERIPEQLVQSPVFQNQENLQFLEFILTKSGFPELTWETLYNIYSALDSTQKARSGSHAWPLWMDSESFVKLKSLVDFSAAAAFSDVTVARLKGGPLLREILHRMATKAACLTEVEAGADCETVSDLSFYGYSADALLVHSLLTALGHSAGSLPGPAAALALELWETASGLEVRALYYDGLSPRSKLREFSIGGCAELQCSLDAFVGRSAEYLPWDWKRECGLLTKGLSAECADEIDTSEAKSCHDWASHGLCEEQPAVRFVFCRRTCLCQEELVKKSRKAKLRLV